MPSRDAGSSGEVVIVELVTTQGAMVLIRQATLAEMDDLAGFTVDDPVGSVDAERFREEVTAGRMRPEWAWFAADGSRIVARALWWGRADSEHPLALDCLHVLAEVPDRAAVGARLLSRGHAGFGAVPQFELGLRVGWPTARLAAT